MAQNMEGRSRRTENSGPSNSRACNQHQSVRRSIALFAFEFSPKSYLLLKPSCRYVNYY